MASIISPEQASKIDKEFLKNLPAGYLLPLTEQLLDTTKTLYDRLNKDSGNSSMPPSSDKPWKKSKKKAKSDKATDSCQMSAEDTPTKLRKKREHGFGRTEKLPITNIVNLYPEKCDYCKALLSKSTCKAYTAYYQIDLKEIDSIGGYQPINTKYVLFKG